MAIQSSSVKRIGRSKLFSRRATDAIRRTRQSTVPGYHHRYLAPPPVYPANLTDLTFVPQLDGSHHRVTIPIRTFLSKPLVLAAIAARPVDRLTDPPLPAVRLPFRPDDTLLPPGQPPHPPEPVPAPPADRHDVPLAVPQTDQARPEQVLPVLLQPVQPRPDPVPDPYLQADQNLMEAI